jgi:tRNA (guanine37-N1)-methyltransferase
MRFDIFTLFPTFFEGPFGHSILKRGLDKGLLEVGIHDIRDWTHDRHRTVDDYPFGGGAGMVMKAEPVANALEDVLKFNAGVSAPPCPVILMTPQGRRFNQRIAEELAAHPRLAFLCGHYEGIDERAVEACVTDEISIGDYILTGGESAAAIIVEAVARLVPGVLGNEQSAAGESFSHGLLEAPHYTRPAVWRGREVPPVLLSGNHGEIEKWRFREGLRRTWLRRPELVEAALRQGNWTRRELNVIEEVQQELKDKAASGPGEESNHEPRFDSLR